MINKNNTNIKRQRIWRLGNVEIAKKAKKQTKKKKRERKRWKEGEKKKQSDKKENFHLYFLTEPGRCYYLQLNGRCLKLKREQVKIHFQRKPSSG